MVIIYNIGVVRLVNLITVLVLILLFLWIMFLKILSMYVETTIRNEELIMEDISNKYISKYLDFYNQESDNLRKLKHDLKNHQLVLESLDKKNQYTQYIDEVFKGIGQVAYIESGNIYIDACLYAKQQEYPEIIFDFDISVAGLVFNEKDLTSLIFNLIDNACNEALKHNKLVSVMIRYTNNLLIIGIKNTCPIKPNFSTDKGEGHGYGLKIIKNIDKIEDVKSNKTKGFIVTIVKNSSIDIYRKLQMEKNKVQKIENEIKGFEQEVYDTDILPNKVDVAILKLPERYKQVFFLKYSHGLHDNKIAEILDISPSTVRTRIKRGKEKLKIILDEMEKVHG